MTDVVAVIQDRRQKAWARRYELYGPSGRKGEQRRRVPNPVAVDRPAMTLDIPALSPADCERFFSHVAKGLGCWTWLGSVNGNRTHKYGSFNIGTKSYRAHRISYVIARGTIPQGLVIDHKCRNPRCVNPDHLEAVTQGENTRRGASYPTHCKWGHELSGDNIYVIGNQRKCRTCRRLRTQKWRAKKHG